MQGPKIPAPVIQDAVNRLAAPGLQAQAVANNLLNTGRVKDVTITSGAYSCTVTQTSRYGPQVDVPDVQAAVPVSVGDVVSLEYIQGNPLLGVYCVPVRPKGPNVLSWTGNDYANQGSTILQRSANSVFQAFVLPTIPASIPTGASYPLTLTPPAGVLQHKIFTIPIKFRVQYPRTAVGVNVSYHVRGGVYVPSFDAARRSFPVRDTFETIRLDLMSGNDRVALHRIRSLDEFGELPESTLNTGAGQAGIDFGGTTFVTPLVWQSVQDAPAMQRYILDTQDLTDYVGQDLTLIGTTKLQFDPFLLWWFDTRDTDSANWTWKHLFGATSPAPTFSFWRGVSDVEITLVEVGTGNA